MTPSPGRANLPRETYSARPETGDQGGDGFVPRFDWSVPRFKAKGREQPSWRPSWPLIVLNLSALVAGIAAIVLSLLSR